MSMYDIYEKVRNERGMTNADVSRLTGISAATLSQWKSGQYIPKAEKLVKIANALNCSVSILTGQKTEGLDYELSLNGNLRLMIEEARKLHENEQEYIVGLIKLLNSKHTKTPHCT